MPVYEFPPPAIPLFSLPMGNSVAAPPSMLSMLCVSGTFLLPPLLASQLAEGELEELHGSAVPSSPLTVGSSRLSAAGRWESSSSIAAASSIFLLIDWDLQCWLFSELDHFEKPKEANLKCLLMDDAVGALALVQTPCWMSDERISAAEMEGARLLSCMILFSTDCIVRRHRGLPPICKRNYHKNSPPPSTCTVI